VAWLAWGRVGARACACVRASKAQQLTAARDKRCASPASHTSSARHLHSLQPRNACTLTHTHTHAHTHTHTTGDVVRPVCGRLRVHDRAHHR
jgi:hypothetical protein